MDKMICVHCRRIMTDGKFSPVYRPMGDGTSRLCWYCDRPECVEASMEGQYE